MLPSSSNNIAFLSPLLQLLPFTSLFPIIYFSIRLLPFPSCLLTPCFYPHFHIFYFPRPYLSVEGGGSQNGAKSSVRLSKFSCCTLIFLWRNFTELQHLPWEVSAHEQHSREDSTEQQNQCTVALRNPVARKPELSCNSLASADTWFYCKRYTIKEFLRVELLKWKDFSQKARLHEEQLNTRDWNSASFL